MRVRRFDKVSVFDRSAFAVAYLSLIPSTHNSTPLTTALGWLVQFDGPNSPLLAHNVLHLAHPAQHSPLADFSLHRLIPTIYLSLLPLTCIFHGRTRRWHRIPPVSSDQGCFFRPDLPCNHSRRFFAILLSPSPQRIQICCQSAIHSIRACVFPQIPDISSHTWRRLRNSPRFHPPACLSTNLRACRCTGTRPPHGLRFIAKCSHH